MHRSHGILSPALLVATLGYFVDIYDLILFLVVKNASLSEIGIPQEALLTVGHHLLDYQMVGMLLGGLVWGILGDRIGRTKVLFGSIILYSLANIANAFVQGLPSYAALRFIAGFGLAGELGAGVTLVAELLPPRLRGYGTTIIASIGVLGAVVAGLTGELLHWRTSYMIGGALGFALLTIRISVSDSDIFHNSKQHHAPRGSLWLIVGSPRRLLRYTLFVVLGLPTWYAIGILIANATSLATALGIPEAPKPGWCIAFGYIGLFAGDMTAGLVSQWMHSRKRPLAAFLALGVIAPLWILTRPSMTLTELYAYIILLGFSAGYWILLVTAAAESFGTNIRATVTTSIPNFIRAAVVPMSAIFLHLKDAHGIVTAALLTGLGASALAILSLILIPESFNKELDFLET